MVHHNYEIGGSFFGIRSTSEAFGAALDDVLAEYRTDQRASPLYSVLVGSDRGDQVRGFHVLYESGYSIARTLHMERIAAVLLSRLDTFVLGDRTDAIYVDANLVRSNGTTALVPSSVAITLSRIGRRVERSSLSLSADMVVAIDPATGLAGSVEPILQIPADSVARLTEAVSGQVGQGPTRLDSVPVDLVLVTGGGGETVHPVSRGYALSVLAGNTVNIIPLGRDGLEGLARFVSRAGCYRVVSDSAQTMLTALTQALTME